MFDEKRFESLVDHIYEAMLDHSEWPAFLSKLSQSLDGTLPMLFMHDADVRTGSVMISVGYDAKAVRDYQNYYQQRNVWLRGAADKQLLVHGTVRTSHMTCSRREFLRSEYYDGWCKPLGISQAIGSTIIKNQTSLFNITVMRNQRAEFGRKEIELFEALMPHLQRALKVHLRIVAAEGQQRELTEVLGRLSVGVMLVANSGDVLFMNAEAERIVGRADGLSVDASGLRAARPQETARLRRLIGEAAETSAGRGLGSGGIMKITRPSGRRAYELLVSPMRGENALSAFNQPIVMVYVSDPAQAPQIPEAALRELYGLTAAEARVAVLGTSGKSVEEIAEALRVSRNTVKTHLKGVFSKTNMKRQTELVRLLLTGISRASPPPR